MYATAVTVSVHLSRSGWFYRAGKERKMWISEFGKPESPLQCYAICNLVWELSGSFLCEHHCVPNCAANNRCSKAKNDTMWTMEQWGPFFSLLLPGGEKKRSLQNKKKLGWYNCFLRLWFGDVKYFFIFSGRRQDDAMHKRMWSARCYTHSRRHTSMPGPCTHENTHSGAHIHGAYQPAPPDVMCVSVYVDRDQRWVLKHFRPLLSPQP